MNAKMGRHKIDSDFGGAIPRQRTAPNVPIRPLPEAIRRLQGEEPPTTCQDALSLAPAISTLLSTINGDRAADLLSGLLTVPELQANADRLEWAVKLALGVGSNGRAPRRSDLDTLLNRDLFDAGIAFRDDPVEDFFVAPIITVWGEFRTFPSRWEGSISATEDLLTAFLALEEWPDKPRAVVETVCLLKLGEAVTKRAGIGRRIVGAGDPWSSIPIPSEERLRRLAMRTRFSAFDLTKLNIPANALLPFVLPDSEKASLLDRWAGDTPLELKPLRARRNGFALVLPGGLTTAARGHLIAAASRAGMLDELHWQLFKAQSQRVDESGYARLPPPRRRKDQLAIRESMVSLSASRVMHFVHTTYDFEGWHFAQFGSIVRMNAQWHSAVSAAIDSARSWAAQNNPNAEVVTFLIMGGWGGGRQYEFAARERWSLVVAPPEALEVLQAGKDGKPEDVFRLLEQLDRAKSLGFEIANTNGLTNMVAWWRKTDHTLVTHVEADEDISSPCFVSVPIDVILDARIETALRLDARALPRPKGPHLRVIRSEPLPAAGVLRPEYVATEPLAEQTLIGAAVADEECWWLDLIGDARDEIVRETWQAALQWLGIVMRAALGDAAATPTLSIAIRLAIETANEPMFDQRRADPWDLTVTDRENPRGPLVTIGAGWMHATARAHNDAELALAATLLALAAELRGDTVTVEQASQVALTAAGSRDLRFCHALPADGALGLLAAHGLVADHRRIPRSAGTLLNCGSAVLVRQADEPRRLQGKGSCLDFLQAFAAAHWTLLLDSVAMFDRTKLVTAVLSRFQAAANEQQRWKSTAAALRAVHGADADRQASHEVMVHANGTMRACALLAEIAGSHAASKGGLVPGIMDVDDLAARTLMLFHVEDMSAAIRLDRAPATFSIGPTGNVLFENEFSARTLQYSSTIHHAETRDEDVSGYASNFKESDNELRIDTALAEAVEAEYGCDYLAFVDMSFAPAQIAIDDGNDVVVLHRSALVERLETLEPFRGKSLAAMITRLTLPVRQGWRDHPTGTTPIDFDIARFDRRLSVSARPLVALTDDEDPLVAFAPNVLQRAVMIAVVGAKSGSLQNLFWTSKEMRRYAGVRGGDIGMGFNQSVAAAVRALGMRAEAEWGVARSIRTSGTPQLDQLGDIDVLTVSPDGRRVWVLEAKDLKLCRSLGEAARRLSDYRGILGTDGKPDKLMRHLRRIAHLRANAEGLMRSLDLPGIPVVSGAMIVGTPQPMQMAPANDDKDATVVRLTDLGTIPWASGWPTKAPNG